MNDETDYWYEIEEEIQNKTLNNRRQFKTPLPGCGHYTGKCGVCGSNDLWDDNGAYGCNKCKSFWCGFAG